ncbi:MAG: cation:proton antiporter [Candidatus Tyrphobacter sp.]
MHVIADTSLWSTAAIWMLLAALSALVGIRLKIAAALVEIVVGVVAGNFLGLHANAWIDFLAGFGSILLTFLAGAEIDPRALRAQLAPAITLGAISFGLPFVVAGMFALYVAHWSLEAAKIAGVAMSTTSVAVVYAVMIESGLATRPLGQLIFAVCFFTGLGTVVALSVLFASANLWLAALVAAIAVSTLLVPKLLPAVLERTGKYVSEPGLRLLFALIFVLSALAAYAKSESVLPAYFLGLACANAMIAQPNVKRQLQTITMTLLTPFYFIKVGSYVSLRDAWAGIGLIGLFFCVKIAAKVLGVLPAARFFRYSPRDSSYLTLLMATGLTFGSIASLYGYTHHDVNRAQYTVLVTVVILTAVIPTLVAQALFRPAEEPEEMESEVP